VLKLGAEGALGLAGGAVHRAPTRPVTAVDAVGAGDAFVGGYLSELVAGGAVPDCLRRGNVLGGLVCATPGDWEGLPTRNELAARTDDTGEIVR
jgi:2-dehydro-3-deoxygluconokinase